LPGTPKLLPNSPFNRLEDVPKQHEFQKLYVHLCIMKYLLDRIQPENNFTERLFNFFEKYPTVNPNAIGLKPNWQNEKLWKK
jgi:abortive infection bacteriophage resistance protein